MSDRQIDPRAKRIVTAGTMIYGPEWRTRFAESVGISKQLMSSITTGLRPVTDDVDAAVTAAINAEIERLGTVIKRLEEMQKKYSKGNGR